MNITNRMPAENPQIPERKEPVELTKRYGRMKIRKNRLTALLLAFVMTACLFWDIPAHAEDVSSSAGEGEKTSAVSESSGPAASPEDKGGAQSEAETPTSSEGQTSEAPASEKEPSEEQASEAPSSEEQPSEEAKDSSSEPEEEHYELEEQELTADVYTDEKRNEESDDGTVITVKGELPEDASVKAYPVEVEDFDGEKVLAAYDITIYGPDGGEFQPEDPVQVSISAPELKDADSVDIYHLKDAGDEEGDAEEEDADEEDADGKETAAEEKDEAKDGGKDADAGAERDDADEDTEKDAEETGGVRARVELDGGTKALNAAKVAEGVKPKNKRVRFKAESFSIYVVTAAASDDGGIDISGTESCTLQVGDNVTLRDSNSSWSWDSWSWNGSWKNNDKNGIINLTDPDNYNHVTVYGEKPGKASVSYTYYTTYGNEYTDTIDIEVEAAGELHTVDTLNSWSLGVNLEMFDYGYSRSGSFSILNSNPGDGLCTDPQEGYTDGTTKEGLLQRVVGSDGFPHTIDAGHGSQQMSKWFTTGSGSEVLRGTYQPANYLFLKSNYDADGSFHYSSAENFAALNGATDDSTGVQNFTVYDKLGTPSNDTRYYYYKRGNFLPYNTINNMRESSNQNEYDLYGKQLDDDDPKKGAPLYLMDQQVNFHFGLYMNTDFLQPEGGLVPKDKADPDGEKKPMKFQFTGDDDLWVYIDGVLILDLGGIHDAQNGTIDFSTGVVTWTDTPTEPTEESKEPEPTSIKDMLDKAVDGNLPNGTRISKTGDDDDPTITYTVTQNTQEGTKTTDIVLEKNADGKYTYKDYSRHTLQMFYMERGSGASNLAIDFNLQTVPKDSVTVTKQVKDLNPYWADQKEYNMQLYVEDEEGDYQLHRGEYTIGTETYSTGEDGTFSLKGDQRAVFSGIDVNKRYYVKEIDPDETDGISYKTTFSTGGEDCTDPEKTDQSEPVSVENEPDMTVTNTAQGTGSITVTKKLEGFTGDNFDAQFELWKVGAGSEADVEIQTASYDDFKDPDDNNGTKSYTFTGLPDGTYYVVETGSTKSTSGILKTTYTVGDSTDAKDDGKEAQVTLNGEQKSGSILITNTYYGEYTLPKAGGSGTLPFQIIGTVILLGAAAGLGFWLYRNKKKKGAPPKDSS